MKLSEMDPWPLSYIPSIHSLFHALAETDNIIENRNRAAQIDRIRATVAHGCICENVNALANGTTPVNVASWRSVTPSGGGSPDIVFTYRIRVPLSGVYAVSWDLEFSTGTWDAGERVRVRLTGADTVDCYKFARGTGARGFSGTADVRVTTNKYIDVALSQNSGGVLTPTRFFLSVRRKLTGAI